MSAVGARDKAAEMEKEAKELVKRARALTSPSLLEMRFKPDWEAAAPLLERAALMYKVLLRWLRAPAHACARLTAAGTCSDPVSGSHGRVGVPHHYTSRACCMPACLPARVLGWTCVCSNSRTGRRRSRRTTGQPAQRSASARSGMRPSTMR